MEFDQIVIIVLGLMAALWLLGATKSGHFILNRRSFATQSAEKSMEGFSQKKKFIEVGSWQVAYIDEGSGEPLILLHGCPFHSTEWKDVILLLAPHYRVIALDFADPRGDRFGLVALVCHWRSAVRSYGAVLRWFCRSIFIAVLKTGRMMSGSTSNPCWAICSSYSFVKVQSVL
jgi:hypothetical protein